MKNSETEISRWRAPISAADKAVFGSVVCGSAAAALCFNIGLDMAGFYLRKIRLRKLESRSGGTLEWRDEFQYSKFHSVAHGLVGA